MTSSRQLPHTLFRQQVDGFVQDCSDSSALAMQLLQCKPSEFSIDSLRPRRNGRYNADDIFKCIFLKENVWIPTKISLKFVPKGPINNISALVQIMAWRRPGDKPLSEPTLIFVPTHICVTRSQWVIEGTYATADLQSIPDISAHHAACNRYDTCILLGEKF